VTQKIIHLCFFLIVLAASSGSAKAQLSWYCDSYPPPNYGGGSTKCVGYQNVALNDASYADSLGYCNNGDTLETNDNSDAENFLAAGAAPASYSDAQVVYDGSTPEGSSAYAWAWTIVNSVQEYNYAIGEVDCDYGASSFFESNGGSYTSAQSYGDRR